MRVRGRYAPSPTGLIHLGNARTALVAWLSVRSQGGEFIWRLEDIDAPRVVPGMAEAAMEDLAWLGLDWDEGGSNGGPHAPYVQSERGTCYEDALEWLAASGRLFPCSRSRRDLAGVASAPHGSEASGPYPACFRPDKLEADWYAPFRKGHRVDAALRFMIENRPVIFRDRVYGTVAERVDRCCGDFVLKRRDGLYAYQLAVCVDDALMGITEVVRGADLLASTARQIQLLQALGATPPQYAHLPLMLNAAGEKICKRDGGLTLRSLRVSGAAAEQVVGFLAYTLGLLRTPIACSAASLVSHFGWGNIRRSSWILDVDPLPFIRGLS